MSRSVSRHRHAVAAVFLNHPFEDDEVFGWPDFVDDLRDNVLVPKYPSLRKCDRWAGREDHVIAENARAEVSVSEYNGVVAVCLAPRDVDNALDRGWAAECASGFCKVLAKAFASSALVPLGRGSNGEEFFRLAEEPGSCVTSKEGRLW
jgi:hypothetical protein